MWDMFCVSHSLQKPFSVFVWSSVIKWTRKVKVLSACSKFSAFSPADFWTGIPPLCVLCLSPGNDACAVREHPDRTKCCHLPPLSWEPEMGSYQRVQDAHLLPWQICHEFCHPQKNPVPLKDAGCCKRPPCCEKACQVWVWCIKASTRLGKEKTWFSGCCRMICNWNSKGRTMFRIAKYCCCCSVFRELLAEVFNGMSPKQLTFLSYLWNMGGFAFWLRDLY